MKRKSDAEIKAEIDKATKERADFEQKLIEHVRAENSVPIDQFCSIYMKWINQRTMWIDALNWTLGNF